MHLNVERPVPTSREKHGGTNEEVISRRVSAPSEISEVKRVREAIVPFNTLETRNWDLLAAFGWLFRPDPMAALRDTLRELTGREHVFFAPSGQCAIAQVVSLLPQREVVMPAYMCGQVKQGIEAVGKRIIYVDQAKNGVNATAAEYAEAARPGRILLAAHLYGIPTDIEAICELAKTRGCVTIEDAVPCVGGRLHGKALGTFADFGIFSFQQSKRLPAFRGGVIVVNNERIVDPDKINATRVVDTKRTLPVGGMLEALIQNFATTPWIYRSLTLPLLGLRGVLPRLSSALRHKAAGGSNKQASAPSLPHTQYYTRELHPYQAELINRMLNRWEAIRQRIAGLVTIYEEAFRQTPIQTFLSPECDRGALMRFPIAFPGKDRAAIISRALGRGVYLKVYWPRPLPEVSEYSKFPNAVWASRNLVLLPLYTALSPRSAELLAQNVIEIERNAPAI